MDHRFEEITDPVDQDAAAPEVASSSVRITVMVQNRIVVPAGPATGSQIRQLVGIPGDFELRRRGRRGNELIRDDDTVDVSSGDHFFARPAGRRG